MLKNQELRKNSSSQYRLKSGDKLGYDLLGNGTEKAFFFHGFPGSRQQGRLIESYCDEFNLQICAFDRPGYGLSEFSKSSRGYSFVTEALEEFAEHSGWDRFHLLAVSGGTPYALNFAAKSPRVVSLHTVCGLGPLSDREFRDRFSLSLVQMMKTAHAVPEFALNAMLRAAIGGSGATFAGYDVGPYLMRSSMRESFRQGVGGAKRDLENYLRADDIDWSKIKCPTNIWHGTADNVVPSAFAEIISARLPHASLRVMPGETHYSLPYRHGRTILRGMREATGVASAAV